MRDRLDELFRDCRRVPVELPHLRGGGTGCAQGFSLADHLTHEPDLLSLGGVETSSGQEQVANDTVAEIALQARDSAESGNEAEPEFGKRKAGEFVREYKIAHQSQFETSAERHSVNGSDGR